MWPWYGSGSSQLHSLPMRDPQAIQVSELPSMYNRNGNFNDTISAITITLLVVIMFQKSCFPTQEATFAVQDLYSGLH